MDYFDTSSMFDELDVYWIVLIVLGIFMFLASIVTIIVLCILWRRHQTSTKQFNDNNHIQIPVQIDPYQLPDYETQRMEIFVPFDEDDTAQRNFGAFRARGTTQDGIQQMQQFNPRMNKAYF